MEGKREISIEDRHRIQFLYEAGKSQVEIAKTVKCSRRGVQSVIKRFKETGSHQNKPKSGRSRKTTGREDRSLVLNSLRDRKKSSVELAPAFSEEIGKRISARTIRRRLGEAGLRGCKARKKPWLSEKNKKARLEWALKHQSWTSDDWDNVIWSDESNFQIFGTAGVTYVRRRTGEEYLPECVVPTVKHGGGGIMVWGCMASDGVGEMFVCEGRMNSEKYINVLEQTLIPSVSKIFGDTNANNLKFQQDNAPCHKSAASMRWLKDNNVDLLEWPAQSPDLNPIEHLWTILKRKVQRHTIKSKEELKIIIEREWSNLTVEDCTNLVRSLPRRIAAVIQAKGGPTRY